MYDRKILGSLWCSGILDCLTSRIAELLSRIQETANLMTRCGLHRCRWRFLRTARHGVLAAGVKPTTRLSLSDKDLQDRTHPPSGLAVHPAAQSNRNVNTSSECGPRLAWLGAASVSELQQVSCSVASRSPCLRQGLATVVRSPLQRAARFQAVLSLDTFCFGSTE